MVRLHRLIDRHGRIFGADAPIALEYLQVVRVQRTKAQAIGVGKKSGKNGSFARISALPRDKTFEEFFRCLKARPFRLSAGPGLTEKVIDGVSQLRYGLPGDGSA